MKFIQNINSIIYNSLLFIFLSLVYLPIDFLNFKISINNTNINYILNDFILIFIFILYIIYFLITICYINQYNKNLTKYINIFVLINQIYLQLIIYIFTICFIYSLYTKINILYFLFIIYYILFLYFFIYFIKNYDIENKIKNNKLKLILLKISKKDYIFYIHRILLIKIFCFYIYFYSNNLFCESIITKFLHDTFMEVGTSIGLNPKTNVSILETIGMFTVLGTISFGTIKIYQYFEGSEHRSLSNRLDNIERQLEENNFKNDQILSQVDIISQEVNVIKKGVKDTQSGVFITSKLIEEKVCTSYNIIIEELSKINTEIINLKQTQDLNIEVQTKLMNLQTEFNIKLDKATKLYNEILTNNETISRETLQNLYNELQDIGVSTNDNLRIVNNILNNSLIPLSITNRINTRRSVQLDPNIVELLGPSFEEAQNNLNVTPMSPITRSSLPIPRININRNEVPVIPDMRVIREKAQKLYKLETNEKSFTFIEYSQNALGSTSNNLAVKAVTVTSDFLFQTVKTVVSQALANSITVTGMLAILKSIGLVTDSSTAETAGKTVVKSIKDFIKGLKNG